MIYNSNVNGQVKMKCGNWKNTDGSSDYMFNLVNSRKVPVLPTFFPNDDFASLPVSIQGNCPDWYLDGNGRIINAVLWSAYSEYAGIDFASNQI